MWAVQWVTENYLGAVWSLSLYHWELISRAQVSDINQDFIKLNFLDVAFYHLESNSD